MDPTTQGREPAQISDSASQGRPGALRRLFQAIVPPRSPEQEKAQAEAAEIEFAEQARQWMTALREGNAQAMRSLQKRKPLADRIGELHAARDAGGRTPLMLAAVSGDASIVELVLASHDPHGRPWLPPLAAPFVDHPAKIADFDGLTALAHAARNGHARCVQLLLSSSDAGFRDKRGEIALMHATRLGHVECVALLAPFSRDRFTANLASTTPLAQAIRSGRVELAEIMLAEGLGREAMTPPFLGESLFCLAARLKGKDAPSSTALLDALARHGLGGALCAGMVGETAARTGANADQATGPGAFDAFGKSPLHHAAEAGNLAAALWLARVAPHTLNSRTRLSGSTPLHEAAHANSAEVLSGLLPLCDPSLTDGLGETAFAVALSCGHFESVRVLAPFSALLAPAIPPNELASLTRLRVPIFRAVSSGRPEIAAWLAGEIETRHGRAAAQEEAREAFRFAVDLGADHSFASADFLAPWIDAEAIRCPWGEGGVSAERQARHETDLARKMPRAFAKMEAVLLSRESGLFGERRAEDEFTPPRRL